MYYNFNPKEKTLKIRVFADSCNENLEQDLSELFHNMNYTVTIRIVDTLYTIKKTKSKITIIEQPFERKIAEYTNYKGIFDIVNFLINQFTWLSIRNTNDFNDDMINNLISDKDNEYVYLYGGIDFGYSIGVVGSMIVLNTPDKKKLATDFYINGENLDFLQVKLDYMIKENMLEIDGEPVNYHSVEGRIVEITYNNSVSYFVEDDYYEYCHIFYEPITETWNVDLRTKIDN